jgi:hypothetical protein
MTILTAFVANILLATPALAISGSQDETYVSVDTGRVVDVYTQRGGIGANASSNDFAAGEEVILSARATYNDFPVQSVSIAFMAQNPLNETVALLVAKTDENGLAQTHFRIPYLPRSEGVWTVTASVDISCTVVFDIVTFRVILYQFVGGYTISLKNTNNEGTPALYLFTLTILTLFFVMVRPSKRARVPE